MCRCAGETLPYPEHDDERMATERYKWLTIEQASAAAGLLSLLVAEGPCVQAHMAGLQDGGTMSSGPQERVCVLGHQPRLTLCSKSCWSGSSACQTNEQTQRDYQPV